MDEQVNEVKEEKNIEKLRIEEIDIPIEIKKDLPDLTEIFNHKIDVEMNTYTKEKIYHEQALSFWIENYNLNKEFNFQTAFTGIIKDNSNTKVFLLYFIEKEKENSYIEIDVTFNINIEDNINEIIFINFINNKLIV